MNTKCGLMLLLLLLLLRMCYVRSTPAVNLSTPTMCLSTPAVNLGNIKLPREIMLLLLLLLVRALRRHYNTAASCRWNFCSSTFLTNIQ